MAFDPSTGELYVGSGADSAKLRRIGVGGSPVVEYGDSSIYDPDAVAFDATGAISGVPGSILVGANGSLLAVHPNETITNPFPTNDFGNINDMNFDSDGRLLFINIDPGTVYQSTGGTPSILFTIPGVARSVVESNGQIYTSDGNGTLRIHTSTGVLLNDSFATGLGRSPHLAFGTGGAFGTDLYTVGDGNLYRVNAAGDVTIIGTGFPAFTFVNFGPDGALYINTGAVANSILRISPAVPEPSALIIWLLLASLAIPFAWWRRRQSM